MNQKEVGVNVKTRRKARRILSDDKDEDDSFKCTSNTRPFSKSPFQFSSVRQFDVSLPQNDKSPPAGSFHLKFLTM
jgi:hypothetical protein